jgi:pectate lyase
MRLTDYLALPPAIAKSAAVINADAITDTSGGFVIIGVTPGDYTIEITDDSASAVLLSCTANETGLVDLGTVTLQPFASIAGQISRLTENAYVQVRGLERVVIADSTGSFVVTDLPAGTFNLHMVTQDGQTAEITNVVAASGDTATVTAAPRWRQVPDGYAQGTTGGGNAMPVTVSSAAEFTTLAAADVPAVIVVDGRLNTGDIAVGSNKTIIGKDTTAGLFGGRVRVEGTNCIFQNLTIGPSGTDAMELSGATNVFIHKCEFFDGGDGLLDIVRQSDFITVSWCRFYYVNQTTHKSVMLIGNSDLDFADSTRLHVTLHHNWYAENCDIYMPRVRFGHVHIYNNYYNSIGNTYCIGVGVYSRIRVENTLFDSVNGAWGDLGGLANDGRIGWQGLVFENTSTPTYATNAFPVFVPPYTYSMDPAGEVKAMVRSGAGNR